MKITCQSCQAKYTIADEKVLGKTVKIKCKKCGASIVVHGSESSPGLPEPSATATPIGVEGAGGGGGEEEGDTRVLNEAGVPGAPSDEWTVNVTDDDQRTLTSAQIAVEYQRGIINGDSYVWKDGMADWLPLSNVAELMQLIGGAAPAAAPLAPPDPYGTPAITEAADPQYGIGGTLMLAPGQGPAATPPPNLSAPATGAAARRAGNRAGGVDLFASSPDRQLSDPGLGENVGPTGERLVGERNESSVLFSLSALNAGKGVPPGSAKKGGEDGVLDLRASPGPPPRNNNNGGRGGGGFDDIMNLGGGMSAAPNLAPPPLLAPVVEAPPQPMPAMAPSAMGAPNAALMMAEPMPQKKSPTGILLGIIGALLVLGGVGAFFAFREPTSTTAAPEATTTTAAPSAAPAAPTETAAPTAAPAETAAATTPSNTPGTIPVGAKPGSFKPGKPTDKPEDKPAEKPAEKPPEKQPEKPAETAAPAAGGKEFDRAAAMSALSKAAGAARGCKKDDGPTGSGKVKVTFAPSGNVTSATVEGPPFAGTPVGGCIASAFRSARVPSFEGAPVSVSKTVNIN